MNKLEFIEFFKPLEDNKNLFIRDIVLHPNLLDPEQAVTHRLHKTFSKFGLLYEVQVLPCSFSKVLHENVSDKNKSIPDSNAESLNYYAFVKFYSSLSAEKAKNALHFTHFVGTKACKVIYAKRKKTGSEKQELFITQCCDLANFYLGYNGWSSSIKEMKKETADIGLSSKEEYCCFVCVTNLVLHNHGLSLNGKGLSVLKYSSEDPTSRMRAYGRCRKQAYQAALQKAFSKLILVVLANGKVYADINSSVPEEVEDVQPSYSSLAVNELQEEPELSGDDSTAENLDEENINILAEMENEINM